MVSSYNPQEQEPVSLRRRRAGIYIRVSDDKQEEGYSFEFQREKALEWIAQTGCLHDEKHVWKDTHTGMEIFERPGLSTMRYAAKREEFDVLVMYKLDRFSRVSWQQEMMREELKLLNVTTVTLNKDEHADDDSPIGAIIRALYSFKAEEERNDILQRTKDGQETKLKNGYLLGAGKATYGYMWNGDGKERTHYLIKPEEAVVVRRIFQLYVHEHWTLRRIAKTLTEEGIPTPNRRCDDWRISSVRKILRNVFYTGKAVYRKTHVVKDGRKKRQIETPESEQMVLPDGLIPPLIDADTFEQAQTRLIHNKEQAARNNKHPEDNLLRGGFVFCGYCGAPMRVIRCQRRWLYYRCWKKDTLYGECETSQIAVTTLDQAVWEKALEIIRDPIQVPEQVQRLRRSDPTADDRETIKKQLADNAREIHNCTKTVRESSNETVRAIMAAELERLAKAQEGLMKAQQDVTEKQEEWTKEQQRLDTFLHRCQEMREKIDDPTFTPTHQFKRDACEYFGLSAYVWRVEHTPRFEIDCAPPSIVLTYV